MKKLLLFIQLASASCIQLWLAWPAMGQQYLYTPAELTVWQSRATSGPYKNKSDAQANSPADWNRIVSNAASFYNNQSAEIWSGYTEVGCIPQNTTTKTYEPEAYAYKLQDAALYGLVTANSSYRNAVKAAVLAQIAKPGVNFADGSRWCIGAGGVNDVNPGFIIAEWVTRLLHAYLYTYDLYSAGQHTTIANFFGPAGTYFAGQVDYALNPLFVNRPGGNYTLAGVGASATPRGLIDYFGPSYVTVNGYFNNRRYSMIYTVAEIGWLVNSTALKNSAALYFKQYLQYAIYPDGRNVETERSVGATGKPEKGTQYMAGATALAIAVADVFARHGDYSLYDYVTTVGAFGSQGAPTGAGNEQFATGKSLKFMMYSLARYWDGTHLRWGTDQASLSTDQGYIMDGVFIPNLIYYEMDTWLALGNLYYQDSYIRKAYLRQYAGARPYNQNPTTAGPYAVWMGPGAPFSGILFQHGQREYDASNPFLAVTPDPPIDTLSVDSLPTPSPRRNVALNKPVSGTVQWLDNYAYYLTDGVKDNFAQRYVSAENNAFDTLDIDLKSNCSIDTIKIYTGKQVSLPVNVSNPVESFRVLYYNSGVWTQAYATTSNASNIVLIPVSIASASKLRIIGRDIDAGGELRKKFTRLVELEAYGTTL